MVDTKVKQLQPSVEKVDKVDSGKEELIKRDNTYLVGLGALGLVSISLRLLGYLDVKDFEYTVVILVVSFVAVLGSEPLE